MVAGSTAIITLLLVVIGTFVIRQVSQIEYRNAVKANQTLAQAMSDRFNENSDAFVHQIDFVTLDGEISDIMEKGGSSQAEIYSNRKELRSVITLRSIAMDAIFSFLWRWNDYMWPLVVIRDTQKYTVQLALANFSGQYAVDWGSLLAMSVLTMIPVLVIFLLFQKQFMKGMIAGAVKG